MKERPILFSGPMVRAILDGRKTQTRRVINPQPDGVMPDGTPYRFETDKHGNRSPQQVKPCPYGQPGDRLWVKETHEFSYRLGRTHCIYKADGHEAPVDHPFGEAPKCYKTRPSIFMFRWASRITLEITAVRVERLQDISEADAIAEGVGKPIGGCWFNYLAPTPLPTGRESFRTLWESINGPGSWDENPLVWVVEFRRLP